MASLPGPALMIIESSEYPGPPGRPPALVGPRPPRPENLKTAFHPMITVNHEPLNSSPCGDQHGDVPLAKTESRIIDDSENLISESSESIALSEMTRISPSPSRCRNH